MGEVRRYRLEIKARPRPKQRPRIGKGHVYTPKETRKWEQLVAWEWLHRYNKPVFPPKVPLIVGAKFSYADRKMADGDNLYKAVLDALNGVAYEDDSRIAMGLWWRPPVPEEKNGAQIVVLPYTVEFAEYLWWLLWAQGKPPKKVVNDGA